MTCEGVLMILILLVDVSTLELDDIVCEDSAMVQMLCRVLVGTSSYFEVLRCLMILILLVDASTMELYDTVCKDSAIVQMLCRVLVGITSYFEVLRCLLLMWSERMVVAVGL